MSGYTPFRRERLEEPDDAPLAVEPPPSTAAASLPPAELHVLGAPDAWRAGFARLRFAPAPAGCSARDWDTLLQGAESFLRHWGAAAAEVGWTAEELFSLHPTAPLGRLDQRGVAFMVGAGEVTAVSADTIRLRSIRGTSDLTLHRRWLNPGPPAWEHFTNQDGPHG